MKKIFIVIVSSIILYLFLWSPLTVSAVTTDRNDVGEGIVQLNNQLYAVDIYSYAVDPTSVSYSYYGWIISFNQTYVFYVNDVETLLTLSNAKYIYIPTLDENQTLVSGSNICYFYTDYDDYVDDIPEEFRPTEPNIWDDFYDWFYNLYGFYPRDDSIIGLLRRLFEGDRTDDTVVVFPTLAPSPTPTPTPTPIPVQTIFVPDGNGNTTIIYQYPDPTTGVITQSPYNPNVTNKIEINCNCDGSSGGDNNPFSSSPQDPYTLDASLFWADGFGVEMSDNPLSAADDSQTNLNAAAEEYNSSVEVLSNSFNVLPFKWITLVGLLGGILILAGLIRTFLGG